MGRVRLCGVDPKEDPRDGVAKLIEVNPRYSLWDDSGIPVGVDLAHEAVDSLLGGPTLRPPIVVNDLPLLRDPRSMRRI